MWLCVAGVVPKSGTTGQDDRDLVELVYGGRVGNPGWVGEPQYSSSYLPALRRLEQVWVEHGNGTNAGDAGCFYDQFYLPTALNATGVMVGRSPMPIAKVIPNHDDQTTVSVRLSIFLQVGETRILYTLDGSDPASAGGHSESDTSLLLAHS